MWTVLGVMRGLAVCGAIALLLWGAAICLGELFGPMFTARAPGREQAPEGSRYWNAASPTQEG
jgi:hypothetical protein